MLAIRRGSRPEGMAMFDVFAISVLAFAIVIPIGANLLWHLIETDPNDTE
jgi:hypothetical protein